MTELGIGPKLSCSAALAFMTALGPADISYANLYLLSTTSPAVLGRKDANSRNQTPGTPQWGQVHPDELRAPHPASATEELAGRTLAHSAPLRMGCEFSAHCSPSCQACLSKQSRSLDSKTTEIGEEIVLETTLLTLGRVQGGRCSRQSLGARAQCTHSDMLAKSACQCLPGYRVVLVTQGRRKEKVKRLRTPEGVLLCHPAWSVETMFHHIGQVDLELLTSRSACLGLPKCWDYRCEPPLPTRSFPLSPRLKCHGTILAHHNLHLPACQSLVKRARSPSFPECWTLSDESYPSSPLGPRGGGVAGPGPGQFNPVTPLDTMTSLQPLVSGDGSCKRLLLPDTPTHSRALEGAAHLIIVAAGLRMQSLSLLWMPLEVAPQLLQAPPGCP
ncbi:hypothetical protein AAY473_030932 [Plecturocebus cupreus]